MEEKLETLQTLIRYAVQDSIQNPFSFKDPIWNAENLVWRFVALKVTVSIYSLVEVKIENSITNSINQINERYLL